MYCFYIALHSFHIYSIYFYCINLEKDYNCFIRGLFIMNSIPNTEIILQVLLAVGLIIVVAKYFGIMARKIGIPEVAGMIVAGLVLRFVPWFHNYGGVEPNLIYAEANQFISYMSEIGVILIMFSAGLGTNLKSLIKSGAKSTAIATCGVFVPLIMGTIMSFFFFGFDGWGTPIFFKSVFTKTDFTNFTNIFIK